VLKVIPSREDVVGAGDATTGPEVLGMTIGRIAREIKRQPEIFRSGSGSG
jgi:hypothetical protein